MSAPVDGVGTAGASSRIVLVHGAWHAGWCWERVVPLLTANGHDVEAVDLPGHGACPAAPETVDLDRYIEHVATRVTADPRPVVLVGHSLAGMVLAGVSERLPGSIAFALYVCAFLPEDGQSGADLAAEDPASSLPQHIVPDEARHVLELSAASAKRCFYHDLPKADQNAAALRLAPQPMAPLFDPVRLTPDRFGRVPRAYVRCDRDRAITVALQRAMLDASPCRAVFELDCGHSPMFACPSKLAAIIDELAAALG